MENPKVVSNPKYNLYNESTCTCLINHSNRNKNDCENDWGRTIVVQGLFPLSKMVVIPLVLEDCTGTVRLELTDFLGSSWRLQWAYRTSLESS